MNHAIYPKHFKDSTSLTKYKLKPSIMKPSSIYERTGNIQA